MRSRGRIDDNQKQIVKQLRQLGVSVQSLASMGKGVPDLLLGFRGINILIELKDGDKVMSKTKLTTDEKDWHNNWNGRVYVAHSIDEIMTIINNQTTNG